MGKRIGLVFFGMLLFVFCWGPPARAQTSPSGSAPQTRWVTLVLDKSGSMKNLAGHMRDAIALFVDVLAYYNHLLPGARVNLLTVYFDREAEVVYAGPVERPEDFKANPRARYVPGGETSIGAAVALAARTLAERRVGPEENMTVLMTDGWKLDEPGDILSRVGARDIARLGPTWFVFLSHPGRPREIPSTLKDWQNLEPLREKSSCSRVEAASDLLPTFFLSLWKYHVARMETKLVRYYQEPLGEGGLVLDKHSPRDALEAIVSRPPGNAGVKGVVSPSGAPLGPDDYEVVQRSSFFTVRLKADLPKGAFKLRLGGTPGERVSLISFEDIPVTARVDLSPERPGAVYPKDSQVTLRFRFWDAKNDLPIDYLAFLRLVFFTYEVGPAGPRAEAVAGSDVTTLTVSDTFAEEGVRTVCFAWHYLPSLLVGKPCTEIGRFTVEGYLRYVLALSFDASLGWEGRRLPLGLGLLSRGGGTPVNFSRFFLQGMVRQSGKATDLCFDAPDYKAELPLAAPGLYDFQYLRAEPAKYARQVSLDRPYRIEVQGRKIQVVRQVMRDASLEERQADKGLFAWWSRFVASLRAVRGRLDPVTLPVDTATEITYPLLVKFSGAQESRLTCTVGLNKLFPDETGFLQVQVPDTQRARGYALEGASESFLSLVFDAVAGLFGLSPTNKTIENAVVLSYDFPEGEQRIGSDADSLRINITLTKKAAWLADDAFPLPCVPLTVKARIETPLGPLQPKPVLLKVELQRTSSLGAYAWSAILTALMALGLFAALCAALWILRGRLRIRARKLRIWETEILGSSPEDFFETLPEKYRRQWMDDKAAFGEEARRAEERRRGGGRRERKALWKRFGKPLPLERTKELGRRCREPNIPSSWDFGPGDILITAYQPGPGCVRHRDEGIGEVGSLRVEVQGDAIQGASFTPAVATPCGDRVCLPGQAWRLTNGAECRIGPDQDMPRFRIRVTWDGQKVHIELYG